MFIDFESQPNSFVSRDIDRCTDYLSSLFVPHKLKKTSMDPLLARVEHVALDKSMVAISSYGASVDIEPVDMQSVYQVKIPLLGELKIQAGALNLEVDTNSGCFISPTKQLRYRLSNKGKFLTVSMESAYFRSRMVKFFGLEAADEIVFNPLLDLANQDCRVWVETVAYIWNEYSQLQNSTPDVSRILKQSYSDLIVDRLLLLHQKDQSGQTIGHAAPVPRILRSATTYIESNFRQKISLEDIAKWSGTSGRTLQVKFKEHFGQTPQSYVRRRRLEEAHKQLISASSPDTVTDIAFDCGISHLGRFANQYREKFGCSPHETLRLGGKQQNHLI